jgi:hypothetical protein
LQLAVARQYIQFSKIVFPGLSKARSQISGASLPTSGFCLLNL